MDEQVPGPADIQAASATAGADEIPAGVDGPVWRRALLVEDSIPNQRIAAHMLERLGFDVSVAGNGQEALAALDGDPFDLVLMDIMMPEMDGITCMREIRRRFQWPRIPIIAVTANTLTGDREFCLEAGADDYVSKPYGFAELEAAVGRRDATTLSGPALRLLDADELDLSWLATGGLLSEGLKAGLSVVDLFRDEARLAISQIYRAILANDARQLDHASRALGVVASNMGAFDLADQAADLERASRNRDLHLAAQMVDRLSSECDQIIAVLEHLERQQRPAA